MRVLKHLFDSNRAWSRRIQAQDPEFFQKLARQQSPAYLWIGCSDSRVPANEIVGLLPGELFVHRNVANVVVHTDLNCLSVMQYAVDVLKVAHIIVCGHYGCGGVRSALHRDRLGLIDNWLRHVQDVRDKHEARLAPLTEEPAQVDRLCELNVIEQVANVCQTTIAHDAWARGQPLAIHGWIYGLRDGLLRDLNVTVTREDEAAAMYGSAMAALE
jgi:carbonic anhydrase